jgi:iron-sulfur cluster repair protein YtfE (RIC family)
MAHHCECHRDDSLDTARVLAAPGPEDIVGEVAHRQPRALETLQALGINHCCGAHLTLREAAAAAGVPLETLLAALADTGAASACSRTA